VDSSGTAFGGNLLFNASCLSFEQVHRAEQRLHELILDKREIVGMFGYRSRKLGESRQAIQPNGNLAPEDKSGRGKSRPVFQSSEHNLKKGLPSLRLF
jgi:hypothetical protein